MANNNGLGILRLFAVLPPNGPLYESIITMTAMTTVTAATTIKMSFISVTKSSVWGLESSHD